MVVDAGEKAGEKEVFRPTVSVHKTSFDLPAPIADLPPAGHRRSNPRL